jgi:hypothetical protein
MRRALVVFLRDTHYTEPHQPPTVMGGGMGSPVVVPPFPAGHGPARWIYRAEDSDQIREVVLASGTLLVFLLDPEGGQPQAHLAGERAQRIGTFPAGGWSGYVWEWFDPTSAPRQSSGIVVPTVN